MRRGRSPLCLRWRVWARRVKHTSRTHRLASNKNRLCQIHDRAADIVSVVNANATVTGNVNANVSATVNANASSTSHRLGGKHRNLPGHTATTLRPLTITVTEVITATLACRRRHTRMAVETSPTLPRAMLSMADSTRCRLSIVHVDPVCPSRKAEAGATIYMNWRIIRSSMVKLTRTFR